MSAEDVTSGQKARVTRLINDCKAEFAELAAEIKNFKTLILEDSENNVSIKTLVSNAYEDIQKKSESAQKKYSEIEDFYSKIFDPDDEAPSLKEELESIKEEIESDMESVDLRKKDFDSFYLKIFGYEDKDGKKVIGLKQEIDEEKKKLFTLKSEAEKEYKVLFEKIEGLLPGATSTGLAKAYQEQKDKFSTPSLIWSAVFILTMCGMIGYAVFTFQEAKTFSEVAARTIGKLPFFVPAIWLGLFASKQQSQNKRLAQEYAFRETLARSYEGYKKQIESLGKTNEAKAVLITLSENLVNIAGQNPSLTLDNHSHKDEPPLMNSALKLFTGEKFLEDKKKD